MGVDVICGAFGEMRDGSSELSSVLRPDGRGGAWPATVAEPEGEMFGVCDMGDTDMSLRCGILDDAQELMMW